MLSEWELNWAYNYNAYQSEFIKAGQMSRQARMDGNPYLFGTWQWLTWEQGLKEILDA